MTSTPTPTSAQLAALASKEVEEFKTIFPDGVMEVEVWGDNGFGCLHFFIRPDGHHLLPPIKGA